MANKFYKVLLQTLFNSNILTENTVSDLDTQQLISQLRKIVNAEDFYIEPKRLQKILRSINASNKDNIEVSEELKKLLTTKVQLTDDKAEAIIDMLEREFNHINLVNLTKYLSTRDSGGRITH